MWSRFWNIVVKRMDSIFKIDAGITFFNVLGEKENVSDVSNASILFTKY